MSHINNIEDVLAHSGLYITKHKTLWLFNNLPEVFTTTQILELEGQYNDK